MAQRSKLSVALAKEALEVRKQTAQGWMRGTSAGRTVARVIKDILGIELADRAMTLAAQGFISVLPVIIAVGTFAHAKPVATTIRDQFGFDPQNAGLTSMALDAANAPTVATFGLFGLIMVVLSGTSFARALGRLYGRVWDLPTLSVKGWWRWVAVLFTVALGFGFLSGTTHLTGRDWVDLPVSFVLELLCWTAVWAAVPHLLTEGRLTGRVLWATAALTSVGLSLARIGGRVYLPIASESAHAKFGALGLVFTAISWMFVLSCVIVAAATAVKALALDEGLLGRLLRGPAPVTPESERLES